MPMSQKLNTYASRSTISAVSNFQHLIGSSAVPHFGTIMQPWVTCTMAENLKELSIYLLLELRSVGTIATFTSRSPRASP